MRKHINPDEQTGKNGEINQIRNGIFLSNEQADDEIDEWPKNNLKRKDPENVRIKIVRDYFLIYEETDSEIHIPTIWNSHQDPENLEREF